MRRLFSAREVPTWVALAVVAATAWTAGLVLARYGWEAGVGLPEAIYLTEVAGLPLPTLAEDLNPEYRALAEEAKQAVARVLAEYPHDVQAVAALAHLHNLAHDDAGEVVCWQRCLELDADFLPAYSSLAMRAANRGEYQEAEQLLRRAMAVPGAVGSFAGTLASVLSDQGRFREAASVLEDSLASYPPTAAQLIALGEAYLRLDEFNKAKDQFQRALRIDRSSTRAHHGLAQALARLGQKEQADKHRAEMTRLKRLENQSKRKNLDEAGEQQGDRIFAPKFVADLLTMIAAVYGSHERSDEAERHLRRAAQLWPEHTGCRAALADLYGQQGRLAEALAVVEELRQIEPEQPAHLKTLGILLGRLARWEEAEKAFRELCAMATDSAVGYAGLAEIYLRSGKNLPLARLLAAKAADLEPSAWNFFVQGSICEQLGDRRGARLALRKAVTLEPRNPRYRQLYSALMEKE